ncbi:MAG: hypothetical protein ACUVX1_03170 [Chloroflexota bacterium]
MVKVTDQAKRALDDLRSDAMSKLPQEGEAKEEPTLRLIIQGSQAGLALDYPQQGDQVVEHNGHPVLVVDPMVGQVLDGTTVDVTDTPEGERLRIYREEEQQK